MIKIEEKELQEARDIRSNYQQVMLEIGKIELQLDDIQGIKNQLNDAKNKLLTRYGELKQNERVKMDDLNKKYGAGNLDLETGIITPFPAQEDSTEK